MPYDYFRAYISSHDERASFIPISVCRSVGNRQILERSALSSGSTESHRASSPPEAIRKREKHHPPINIKSARKFNRDTATYHSRNRWSGLITLGQTSNQLYSRARSGEIVVQKYAVTC